VSETLLANQWTSLPLKRKLSLLDDLEDLGEHDTLMDFTAVGTVALTDADEQVRETALHLFWDSEDKAFITIGLNLLTNDPSAHVRATTASILGHFVFLGETDAIPEELANRIVERLLVAHKSDTEKLVKRRALESLGYSSLAEIHKLISQAVALQDNEWLASGLYAMGRSADPSWAKFIRNHLNHQDESVREEAVRAAGELELMDMREVLLSLMDEEEDDDIRAAIIWSLSQIGGEGVRDAFTQLMETAEDDEFIDFLENAIDNLNFTDELAQFDLFDIDQE
jgi:HEAT repeat protein